MMTLINTEVWNWFIYFSNGHKIQGHSGKKKKRISHVEVKRHGGALWSFMLHVLQQQGDGGQEASLCI